MSNQYVNNAIFWVEVEKISPNPYQPRKEFDEMALQSLAESIRTYGVLQPLVVTRKEVFHEEGGMTVEYELISGERRLRASKLARLSQVPVLIRSGEEGAREKLEIAIIENLQREDINSVERAQAFSRLIKEFKLKQADIASKVGKSREYVANTLRILTLPEDIITALSEGRISEGHTRPLLMLVDKPEEQLVLFKEIMAKKLSVREAESLSRRVATDRIRNKEKYLDPVIIEMEKSFTETLGTRVRIEKGKEGGKVTIDFFSPDDLRALLERLGKGNTNIRMEHPVGEPSGDPAESPTGSNATNSESINAPAAAVAVDDRPTEEVKKDENEDIYSLKNFSI
jgi:ParB family chromosome partitioning protein